MCEPCKKNSCEIWAPTHHLNVFKQPLLMLWELIQKLNRTITMLGGGFGRRLWLIL
jgi:hypothetical protein